MVFSICLSFLLLMSFSGEKPFYNYLPIFIFGWRYLVKIGDIIYLVKFFEFFIFRSRWFLNLTNSDHFSCLSVVNSWNWVVFLIPGALINTKKSWTIFGSAIRKNLAKNIKLKLSLSHPNTTLKKKYSNKFHLFLTV